MCLIAQLTTFKKSNKNKDIPLRLLSNHNSLHDQFPFKNQEGYVHYFHRKVVFGVLKLYDVLKPPQKERRWEKVIKWQASASLWRWEKQKDEGIVCAPRYHLLSVGYENTENRMLGWNRHEIQFDELVCVFTAATPEHLKIKIQLCGSNLPELNNLRQELRPELVVYWKCSTFRVKTDSNYVPTVTLYSA